MILCNSSCLAKIDVLLQGQVCIVPCIHRHHENIFIDCTCVGGTDCVFLYILYIRVCVCSCKV